MNEIFSDEDPDQCINCGGDGRSCGCGFLMAKPTGEIPAISDDCLSLHEIKKHIKKLSDGKLLEALEYVQDIRKQRVNS